MQDKQKEREKPCFNDGGLLVVGSLITYLKRDCQNVVTDSL